MHLRQMLSGSMVAMMLPYLLSTATNDGPLAGLKVIQCFFRLIWSEVRTLGHVVVEVRLIMLPVSPPGRTLPWAARFLTYVQCLDIVPQQHGSVLERTTQMHVLKRAMRAGAMPFGDILPLDQLRSFTHIIPRFGPVADTRLMPQNSSKFAQSFFLNKYIDKDFYQIISESNAVA